jgi:hypothetical protein
MPNSAGVYVHRQPKQQLEIRLLYLAICSELSVRERPWLTCCHRYSRASMAMLKELAMRIPTLSLTDVAPRLNSPFSAGTGARFP